MLHPDLSRLRLPGAQTRRAASRGRWLIRCLPLAFALAFLTGLLPAQGRKLIIIDPGHGGEDHGIVGAAGTQEKALVFRVAERLRQILESTTAFDVRLTRPADQNVPLIQRAAQTNQAGAALFVSLHCEGSRRKEDRGVSLFYFRTAGKEPAGKDVIRGMIDGREIRMAPLGIAQTAWQQPSRRLAEIIQQRLGLVFPMYAENPIGERLYILSVLNCPAVAVGVGFLTNAEDEKDFSSPRVQDEFCRRLCDAITDFLQ